MTDILYNKFNELRDFIDSCVIDEDSKIRLKAKLSDLQSYAESEIVNAGNEKVADVKKDFKRAYTELTNNYIKLKEHRDVILQQLSKANSRQGLLAKQEADREYSITNKVNDKKESNVLEHLDRVKDGNISFKDDIDMGLIVELYMEGYGAGRIKAELEKLGTKVSRQTIVNRLTRIGLWGNREVWLDSKRTDDELKYINKHRIDIGNITNIVSRYN